MNVGSCVFSQIMELVPWRVLEKIVDEYQGDFHVTAMKTHQFFRILAFAQLACRRSLRATVSGLRAMKPKWYHMGIDAVSLNNLSNALSQRDWKIFAKFGNYLMTEVAELYGKTPSKLNLDAKLFALDSTTIDLCMSVFPWAEFRSTKSAVKVHTLLDTDTEMPVFIRVLRGKTHDVNVLDDVPICNGAYYVMDKAYLDFERLYHLHTSGAWFVMRAKRNTKMRRLYSRKVDKATGVRSDQTVVLEATGTRKKYPVKLRRVHYYDAEHDRRFVFLSNQFSLPAEKIAMIYKRRWEVELFFKWIKQNLRIRAFFGHSENAVKTQIWVAISVYLLIAKLRHFLQINAPLSGILQNLQLVQFDNTPIFRMFNEKTTKPESDTSAKQLFLAGF